MILEIFDSMAAETHKNIMLGYCLNASRVTVGLATISAAGVV